VSHFGNRVRQLRIERGLTLERVAKKIGSEKGYLSEIENHKVNPPSVKVINKVAKLLGQDVRTLVLLAWVDKAPAMLRKDAGEFLKWIQQEPGSPE
jgi:transcriptional regulator with XRE-family HTH domain